MPDVEPITTEAIACPRRGAREPLRIAYGFATFAMYQASLRDGFALGGCEIEATSPDWRCGHCGHEWADGTTRARVEAFQASRRMPRRQDDRDDAHSATLGTRVGGKARRVHRDTFIVCAFIVCARVLPAHA